MDGYKPKLCKKKKNHDIKQSSNNKILHYKIPFTQGPHVFLYSSKCFYEVHEIYYQSVLKTKNIIWLVLDAMIKPIAMLLQMALITFSHWFSPYSHSTSSSGLALFKFFRHYCFSLCVLNIPMIIYPILQWWEKSAELVWPYIGKEKALVSLICSHTKMIFIRIKEPN